MDLRKMWAESRCDEVAVEAEGVFEATFRLSDRQISALCIAALSMDSLCSRYAFNPKIYRLSLHGKIKAQSSLVL